jgi:hypothetical protein
MSVLVGNTQKLVEDDLVARDAIDHATLEIFTRKARNLASLLCRFSSAKGM